MCKNTLFLCAALLLWACDDDASGDDDRDGALPGDASAADTSVGWDASADASADAMQPEKVTVGITSHKDFDVVSSSTILVKGSYTGQPTRVTVNGETAEFADGLFECRIVLEPMEGDQQIEVKADEATQTITVKLDMTYPRIDFSAPKRGSHQIAKQGTVEFDVEDEGGLDDVLFDGPRGEYSVSSSSAHSSLSETYNLGLNILQVTAKDLGGLTSHEHSAVLVGDLTAGDAVLKNAIRLHMGSAALSSLQNMLVQKIDNFDFSSLASSADAESNFNLTLKNITFTKPDSDRLNLSFNADQNQIDFKIHFSRVQAQMEYKLSHNVTIPFSANLASLDVSGGLYIAMDQGKLKVELRDVDPKLEGLQITLGTLPANYQGTESELTIIIEEVIANFVKQKIDEFVPGFIEPIVSKLDEPFDLTLLGAQLSLGLKPSTVVITSKGLSARVDVGIDLKNPATEKPPIAGYVGNGSHWDGVHDTDNLALSIDTNLFNAFAYRIWESGALFPTIDQAFLDQNGSTLRIILSFFGNLLHNAYSEINATTPLSLTATPKLPIQVKALSEGNAQLELGVGALAIHVQTDDAAARDLLDGSASIRMKTTLSVKKQGQKTLLGLSFSDELVAFDVETESLRGNIEASVETPFMKILNQLLPLVGSIVSGIELPSFDLFSIDNIKVMTEPADSAAGFITIEGNLGL